jgi:hypothetical protein
MSATAHPGKAAHLDQDFLAVHEQAVHRAEQN